MKVELQALAASAKPLLQQLLQLYLYDFSEYDGEEINEHGYYTYNYLDYYWTEEGRHTFLIKVEENIAGFVLLAKHCFVLNVEDRLSISEFFIMRKYRRKGIGKQVALEILEKYPVHWEIAHYTSNKASLIFWEEVVKSHLGSLDKVEFKEIENGKKRIMMFKK